MNKWLVSAYALRCVCHVFAPSASLCLCSDLELSAPLQPRDSESQRTDSKRSEGPSSPVHLDLWKEGRLSERSFSEAVSPAGGRTASRGHWGTVHQLQGGPPCASAEGWVGTGEALPCLAVRVFSAAASASASPCWTLESSSVGLAPSRRPRPSTPSPWLAFPAGRMAVLSLLCAPSPHTCPLTCCPGGPSPILLPSCLACPMHVGGRPMVSDLPVGLHHSRPVLSWPLSLARNFVFCPLRPLPACFYHLPTFWFIWWFPN